jgi:putative hydrolase of the HAD superfamily
MKYKHLFFDLDHTLWDFDVNAKLALRDLYETLSLKEKGVDDFELFYKNYLEHNHHLWALYRQGLIQQPTLRVKRMRLALLDFRIADDTLAEIMSKQFLELLPAQNALFPYAMEILNYLCEKNYTLHLITNGFEEVQHHKIRHAKINHFFEEVFTSERCLSLKPNKEIFEFALAATKANSKESIMLGDDLEIDIMGASNAGLDQVYINYKKISHHFKPTYEVFSLKELEEIF